MTKPLLEVDDLWVSFPGADRNIDVVRGISFSIGREKSASWVNPAPANR